MQNINGQMVDTDKIEALRAYYDRELDAHDWCDFDAEADENYELTVTIRKSQYDAMVDSTYTLKQQYTWASRLADHRMNEICDLKEQVLELHEHIINKVYMPGWFDVLGKNGDLEEYEKGKLLVNHQLPIMEDNLSELYEVGVTRQEVEQYAFRKYREWKKEKENGIQLDTEGSTEE